MTEGQEIIKNHFGTTANHFRHIADDIDKKLNEKKDVIKLLSGDCDRLRLELDTANGVIR